MRHNWQRRIDCVARWVVTISLVLGGLGEPKLLPAFAEALGTGSKHSIATDETTLPTETATLTPIPELTEPAATAITATVTETPAPLTVTPEPILTATPPPRQPQVRPQKSHLRLPRRFRRRPVTAPTHCPRPIYLCCSWKTEASSERKVSCLTSDPASFLAPPQAPSTWRRMRSGSAWSRHRKQRGLQAKPLRFVKMVLWPRRRHPRRNRGEE